VYRDIIAALTCMKSSRVPLQASRNLRLKPLLKWAGGKRQLLPQIRRFYPVRFNGYAEAFAGSAAVFFDLSTSGVLAARPSTLIDNNEDLIGCYRMVRDRTTEVIAALRELEAEYRAGGGEHFYRVRDGQFNPARVSVTERRDSLWRAYTPRLAAMLIYLNRTGFNGLFRLNSKGQFNVPHGRYSNPSICDERNLRTVAAALDGERVQLLHASFEAVLDRASAGDFIYFDPPYAPLSATSAFTSYTAGGFDRKDQERLRDVIVRLVRKKCHVLLSNSTAPQISALYDTPSMRRLGIDAHRVPARRAINSDPRARGNVDEYLITNILPAGTDGRRRPRRPGIPAKRRTAPTSSTPALSSL
jgi:DNA adenine methylase